MTVQKGKPNSRLRDERIRRHWSQQELADMVGATLNTVSRWERGLTDCSPYFRSKLCDVFGKTASQLWLIPDPNEEEAHPALYDPVLPAGRKLVGRDDVLKQLKDELHCTQEGSTCALVGMPGVGKSAIALAFAHDTGVRECFYEGILWADVSAQPNILNILSRWGALLGAEPSANSDLTIRDAWLLGLRMAVGTRRMLFIIDNVWRLEDAMVLTHVGGPYCTYLVTTRFTNIALHAAGEHMITVPELTEEQGLQLLEKLAPTAVKEERERSLQLVQSVGGLPLALVLIGQYLRLEAHNHQSRRLQLALMLLCHPEQRLRLEQPMMTLAHSTIYSTLSLQATIALSDRHVSIQAQNALRLLSVFPAKPSTFLESSALAITGTPVEVFDQLCDAGLLECRGLDRYSLHPCIADYASLHIEKHLVEQSFTIYFAGLLDTVETDREWIHVFEQEQANLFAALVFASKHRMNAEQEKLITAFLRFRDSRELENHVGAVLRSIPPGLRMSENFAALAQLLDQLEKSEWMQHWSCSCQASACDRAPMIVDRSYLITVNGAREYDKTFRVSQAIPESSWDCPGPCSGTGPGQSLFARPDGNDCG